MADDATMSIVLVTANMGGIDPIFALPPGPAGIDAFYFTDSPDPTPGWTKVALPSAGLPRMEAKRVKCQIHSLAETQNYQWLAWADASFRFLSLEFFKELAEQIGTDGKRAALVPHPHRRTPAEEYEYILDQIARRNTYLRARYNRGDLERERDHFAKEYDLTRPGLWAGGLWMFANAPRSHGFFDDWWQTVQRFSILDQPAMSPLLARWQIEPLAFDVSLYKCPYFERTEHA